MRISLDSETTGLDIYHKSRPFFVTICFEDGKQLWWEWPVNPHTRDVLIPNDDLAEIQSFLDGASEIVGQNLKFDVGMLAVIGITVDWSKVRDTLIGSHLLESNQKHNLTTLALRYLGKDISPYESKLRDAVQAARRLCRRDFPDWRIAREGLPELPSVKSGKGREESGAEKGSEWAADFWLPRAVATELRFDEGHKFFPWYTALRDYSNIDSACVLPIWRLMEKEIRKRGLEKIYWSRMKLPPISTKIEDAGVTVSKERFDQVYEECAQEARQYAQVCRSVAAGYGYELKLPKSGNNASLTNFAEKVMEEVIAAHPEAGRHIPRTPTGKIQVTKETIAYYESISPHRSPARLFWQSLRSMRRRDKAITAMDGYRRYWLPVEGHPGWYRLHPRLNQTGTKTLRFSSSDPNSQNWSKQEDICDNCENREPDKSSCKLCGGKGITFRSLRYLLGPLPGWEWWTFDAQNIELRVPFYRCGEKVLTDLFEKPNDPPYYGSNHLANFHVVYPEIWQEELGRVGFEKVGPECKKKYKATWYQWCKNGGFCKQYGGQKAKTDATFRRKGAFELMESKFSRLSALNRQMISMANRLGYVETIPDKSVDPTKGYPLMCAQTEWGQVMPTTPLNYFSSGTAMWWMGRAMERSQDQLDSWREEDGFDGHMILQVHDELAFAFPQAADPRVDPENSNLWRARVIQKGMERGGEDIGIPTPVSCNYHPSTYSEEVSF